jgi:hypothetical protein
VIRSSQNATAAAAPPPRQSGHASNEPRGRLVRLACARTRSCPSASVNATHSLRGPKGPLIERVGPDIRPYVVFALDATRLDAGNACG